MIRFTVFCSHQLSPLTRITILCIYCLSLPLSECQSSSSLVSQLLYALALIPSLDSGKLKLSVFLLYFMLHFVFWFLAWINVSLLAHHHLPLCFLHLGPHKRRNLWQTSALNSRFFKDIRHIACKTIQPWKRTVKNITKSLKWKNSCPWWVYVTF